jgi:predicted MFS family arabinose efflux permease
MTETQAIDRPHGSEWRAHWRVVLGAAIGMGTAFSLYQYVSSLFLKELSAEFGWTRGQVFGAFAMGLVGALCAPLVGRIVDAVGVRPVLIVCTLLLGGVYVGLANMPGELGVFFGLIATMAIVGTGCGALAYTRAVNSWFVRNRGLALGCTIGGVSLFAILMPPVLNWIITQYDWRMAYYALGALAVFVGLPIVLTTVWERREAVRAGRAAEAADASMSVGLGWGEAIRTRHYWLLIAAMILVNVAGAGLLSQLAAMLTDRGLTREVAAWLLSAFGLSVLIGRIGTGFLVDRMAPSGVAFLFTGILPAIGCALLLAPASPEAAFGLALAAVILLGLQQGAEMDLLGFFVARQFGMKTYSSIFGSMITAIALSSAAGVAMWGAAFDRSGDYTVALLASVVAFPLAGLCFLGLAGAGRRFDAPAEARVAGA